MTDTARSFLQALIDVPDDLCEIAAMLVEAAGAKGVELRDATTLPPPGSEPVPSGRCHVIAWLESGTDREDLSGRLLADLQAAWGRGGLGGDPAARVSFTTVDAEDWVRKVRESVRPVRVGRRLLVRPSWTAAEESRRGDVVEIVLDPGLAFGTGHHATTALCLEAVERLLEEERGERPAPSILDVGTGSGILAIAAALLGARRCVGIDNDPMAVKVAEENARDNGVGEAVEMTMEPPGSLDGVFEIVVANIHLGPLTALAPQIAPRVAPGGRLLLSGLLEDQADAAEKAYADEGLEPAGRRVLDGWALVEMRR